MGILYKVFSYGVKQTSLKKSITCQIFFVWCSIYEKFLTSSRKLNKVMGLPAGGLDHLSNLSYHQCLINKETMMTEKENEATSVATGNDNSENLIQEFKSYPDMCRRLNLEIKTGGAKQNQMKDLSMRFHLEVSRQKITLRGRGKEEMMRLEAEEREKKKTAGFLELNPRVVMNQRKFLLMLKIKESLKASREIPEDSTSSDGYYAVFDFKEMDSFLGLVNNRFQDDKDYEEGLDDFYTEVRNKNKEVTLSLCHSLISSGFVEGYKSYFVTMESGEEQVIPFQLLKDITNLELNVFEALGVRSKQEIHNKGLWRDFNEKRKDYLKMKFGIISIRSCFVFSTTERICDWFLENNVREFASRGNLRMEINSVNVAKLEKHMEQVYQRNLIKPKTILEESIVPQLKTWDEGKFDNIRDEEGRCLTEIANVRVAVPLPDNFVEKQKEFIAKRVDLRGEKR